MENKKIKLIVGSSAVALGVLGIGAFALFTDNDNDGIKSTAGSVEVDLSDIALENNDNINPGDNDEDIPDTYIPDPDDPLYKEDPETGEPIPVPIKTTPHDLTFDISNTGTKSIRTRQTFIIRCKQKDVTLNPHYLSLLIDDGIELGSAKGLGVKTFVLADGSEVESFEDTDEVIAIKYQLTPDIFDGVGKAAEIEENATVKAVDDVSEKTYTYKLKMEANTPNEYQGSDISIDIVIEAMQYRNTGASDWQLMTTKTVSGVLTGLNQSTVPNASE